jgi:hypothetical protein
MMKKILLSTFLAAAIGAAACSGMPKSFCIVKASRSGNNVICGVITAKTSHSLQMNVIDVFSGTETRTTITIWDGTDYKCTSNISMKAGDLGSIGDTIIAILPLISGVPQNTWDVQGDYRRPVSLFEIAWLDVRSDTVWGYIGGSHSAPVMKYAYAGFKTYWQIHNSDCVTLSVGELMAEGVRVIINYGGIAVSSLSGKPLMVKLYAVDGRMIETTFPERKHEIICDQLSPGVYLLHVSDGNNAVLTKKVIIL